MQNELTPPTTQAEALRMIEPLDPALPRGAFTPEQTQLAYDRLYNFVTMLIPK